MNRRSIFNSRAWPVLIALLAAGCAVLRPTVPVSENSAVIGLVDVARADVDAGRLPNAVAALERALRIEPKNPRLWQELARVRLQEGNYAQAENLATRSNSWAGADNDLRAENWHLIAEARAARGDDPGAKQALERARQIAR
jgi:cytochrome c-type biogenesis protein CcmH/NrfG